jgi:Tfp pilus assembly protein PilO
MSETKVIIIIVLLFIIAVLPFPTGLLINSNQKNLKNSMQMKLKKQTNQKNQKTAINLSNKRNINNNHLTNN